MNITFSIATMIIVISVFPIFRVLCSEAKPLARSVVVGSYMYVSRVIRDIIDDMLWYLPDNLIQIRIFNEVFPRVMGFMSKIFTQ